MQNQQAVNSVDFSALSDLGLPGLVIATLVTVVVPVLWKRSEAASREQIRLLTEERDRALRDREDCQRNAMDAMIKARDEIRELEHLIREQSSKR